MSDIKIFVSHRIDIDSELINNSLYVPVKCGAVFANNIPSNMVGDNTGDNISERRMSFCEFTVQYWAWKNVQADYYGLCHYRRYLYFSGERHHADERNMIHVPYISERVIKDFRLDDSKIIQETVKQYDVLMLAASDISKEPTPQGNKDNIWDHWVGRDNELIYARDLEILFKLIEELYPEYFESAKVYFKQRYHIGFNCFVMKACLFDEMCKFQFDILFEFEKYVDMSSYRGFLERTPGYMGEILYGIYIYHLQQTGKYKIKEIPVVYFEETRKIEKNLCGQVFRLKSSIVFFIKKYFTYIFPKGTKRREVVKKIVQPFRR